MAASGQRPLGACASAGRPQVAQGGSSGCGVNMIESSNLSRVRADLVHQSNAVHTVPQLRAVQSWARIWQLRQVVPHSPRSTKPRHPGVWQRACRAMPAHTTGAAPASSSSQRGHPGVLRPKAGPPHVCLVVAIALVSHKAVA